MIELLFFEFQVMPKICSDTDGNYKVFTMEVHKKNHLFYLILFHFKLFFFFFLFHIIFFNFISFCFFVFYLIVSNSLIKHFYFIFFEKNISYLDKFNFFRIEMTNFVCRKSILFELIAFKYSHRLHFYTILFSFHFIFICFQD